MFRRRKSKKKAHDEAIEIEKIARLEEAETQAFWLRARANRATANLEARQRRNHWRESIEQMIQGAR